MSKNKYKRLVIDILVFVVGTVLTKAVQFLLMPLYTTYLSTEAYGIAELINNVSELFFPIVTLCIYEAAFRFVIESDCNEEEISTASYKLLMRSSLVAIAIYLVVQFVYPYKYLIYLYYILYAYSLRMISAYYVRGKGYTKLFATSGIVNALSLAAFTSLFLVVMGMREEGYLLSIGSAYFVSALYLIIGGKVYKDIKWKNNSRKVMTKMLRYSSPLILYNIGYWLTTMSGRYILLWYTTTSIVGKYAAVIKLSAVINMLQQAFYAALQLNTSREYESSDREQYYSNIFKYYAIGVLIMGSLIMSLSPFIAWFTLKNEFYAARVYLPIILFVAILDTLFCFYKTMYTTYKKTKEAVPSMLIGTLVNIILCIVLIPRIKIWGVCIASLFCYLSQAIYRIYNVKRFVRINVNWKVIVFGLSILFIQVLLITGDRFLYYIIAALISGIYFIATSLVMKKETQFIMNKIKERVVKN